MLEVMKHLLRSKDTCVLATVSGNEPHCSLMSYAVDEDCREIYMMTFRNTRKYENLASNPAVSLLVDTREGDSPKERGQTKALTVSGQFERIEGEERKNRIKDRLLERHPHLKAFAENPDTEVFLIKVKSFQLLDGLTDASFVTLD
ncbi:MAG: Pyridoxamine 5'-phosphate oxidase [Syntrophus sp. PtaU1.Bin208]|nr:MAG: Pyridoxamine 5'-phosphate oxidase [Syntrophus sp. PtaU1.Bin208]